MVDGAKFAVVSSLLGSISGMKEGGKGAYGMTQVSRGGDYPFAR